jgi:hypothetical protein
MAAELRLALPWAPWLAEQAGDLAIRRAEDDVLSYDDGLTLEVRVLDPARYPSAGALLADAGEQQQPGQVLLAAGVVPISWRDELRDGELSFIDVSGVMDISWPRLRVTATRFAPSVPRQPAVMALQQGHALILEELLIGTAKGARPTISKLASGAGVSLSAASRAIAQLCEHGLAVKERTAGSVIITLADRVAAAGLLAAQTAWPGDDLAGGYLDARDGWDLAARVSLAAARSGLDLAVTGGAGAAFLGAAEPPPQVRCWLAPGPQSLAALVPQLGLEPAHEGHANVLLAADAWRVGTHRRSQVSHAGQVASVAHPVRVWCDLHSEPEGHTAADWLGKAVIYGSRSQSKR